MENLLSIKDLSVKGIEQILEDAQRILDGETKSIGQKTAALLFYEASTRTKMSFEMAAHRLGISLLGFSPETSSVQKGESLYDTVKTVEAIGADIVIIRHPEDAYYNQLQQNITIPIVNAGDGKGEHPTQCLLDLLTIYQEFGTFQNIKVVIAGDILHSRVAKSNAFALRKLGADVMFSAPSVWKDLSLPYDYVSMDEAVENCDVLMLLRVQNERHAGASSMTNEEYLAAYGLTTAREKAMKKNSILLHPAPINRGVEIESHLVECDRSRIFKQMNNGVAVRMAILNQLLQKGGHLHVVAN
ncbi:aspartate carbamoyltransferase catalytic subunit [Salirhabdus euzebyi]|uniref:Aspartate carbamoyltransferase n=1 Tax=Salirhabdus euzebyi TaxID=394506 RepID=A0A841Q3L1_9BACI|nr:aspartate carbamoyltransferase catalytic subunit [Salirhabdus euzebyi]MBB6452991.1 aspartate carbamoyltransferase catalytic subunit [Salirhabdus euzebyi]